MRVRFIALSIAMVVMLSGCTKTKETMYNTQVDLESVLTEVDYIVNARYNGVENIDYERLKNNFNESTYEQLEDKFTDKNLEYVNVEYDYLEAKSSFDAYKDRIDNQNNKIVNSKDNENKVVDKSTVDGKDEEQEELVFDDAELLDIKIQMMSDMNNSDGDIVWAGRTEEEINEMTNEEIQEFIEIKERAIKSFTDKHSEYDEELKKKLEEEEQRIADSKDNTTGAEVITDEPIEIDMNQFITDERIVEKDGIHVIMLDDIDLKSKDLNYTIYGIKFTKSLEGVMRPFSTVKGDEAYHFSRQYYALYDTNAIYVSYSSNDIETNRSYVIRLEIDVNNGLISIPDIDDIVSTEW